MSSRKFKDDAILAWSVDDFEQLNDLAKSRNIASNVPYAPLLVATSF